jgi:integration host factor subunit beta
MTRADPAQGRFLMETVTKKELAYRIASKLGYRKVVVKRIIQQFILEIIGELERGNRLEFREFGVFEIKSRAARKARNPRTGDSVSVPSKVVVHFKAGRMMKDMVQRALEKAAREARHHREQGAEARTRESEARG